MNWEELEEMDEMSDEISRLQYSNGSLRDRLKKDAVELDRLRAENERLGKYTKKLEKALDEDIWRKIKRAMEEE